MRLSSSSLLIHWSDHQNWCRVEGMPLLHIHLIKKIFCHTLVVIRFISFASNFHCLIVLKSKNIMMFLSFHGRLNEFIHEEQIQKKGAHDCKSSTLCKNEHWRGEHIKRREFLKVLRIMLLKMKSSNISHHESFPYKRCCKDRTSWRYPCFSYCLLNGSIKEVVSFICIMI